jgi:hypothetical protein
MPGESATVFPEGAAYRWPAGTPLRLRVRYRDTPTPPFDRSSVSLQLTSQAAREIRHLRLHRGSTRLSCAVDVLAIRPELPSSGGPLQVIARQPDGTSEPLLFIRRYDSGAPATYRFRRPVPLANDTVVEVVTFEAESPVTLDYVRRPVAYSGRTGTENAVTNTSCAR